MNREKALPLIGICLLIIIGTAMAQLISQALVRTHGNINVTTTGLEIYPDNFEWGSIKNVPISIQRSASIFNNGPADEIVTMRWINLNPLNLTDYANLAWNLTEPYILPKQTTIIATFTLTIYANASSPTDFWFDILIEGTA